MAHGSRTTALALLAVLTATPMLAHAQHAGFNRSFHGGGFAPRAAAPVFRAGPGQPRFAGNAYGARRLSQNGGYGRGAVYGGLYGYGLYNYTPGVVAAAEGYAPQPAYAGPGLNGCVPIPPPGAPQAGYAPGTVFCGPSAYDYP